MMLLENDHRFQYATIAGKKYLLVEPDTLYALEARIGTLRAALEFYSQFEISFRFVGGMMDGPQRVLGEQAYGQLARQALERDKE